MEIVIDTSAVIAVMSEQPEKVEMIQLTRGATLVAPSSLHWEIGNALSAMFKRRAIVFAEAIQAMKAYREIPIRLLDIDLERALELSNRLNIYAYDAYFLACAVNQRASLLTLDRALREKARELKVAVLEVHQP